MKKEEKGKKEILIVVNNLNRSEINDLKIWANRVREIQVDSNLSYREKIKSIKLLDNKRAFKSLTKIVKDRTKKTWKKASWAKRLGVIGAGGALLTVGGSGAGIAALGGAIGLPLFLLTAAGGALIGTVIDELDRKK